MKATEYLEKYKDSIQVGGVPQQLSPLLGDFLGETADLISNRKCRSVSAVTGVIKELNTKYIKTASLINKHLGEDYIRPEGYLIMFKQVNPQIVNPITNKHIVDDILPPSL